MGIFATVSVDNSIELPHFPEELDRDTMSWQSKQGLDKYGGTYRITADGRLEQKQKSWRDKPSDEKQTEAEKWGFDSWEGYLRAYDESDEDSMVPDAIEGEITFDDDSEDPPTVRPNEQVVDEVWWGDCNKHGSFEFHQAIREDPVEWETLGPNGSVERPSEYALDVLLQYEARFTKGTLDEIVFQGSRATNTDNPIEEALDKIEEWRAWREEE